MEYFEISHTENRFHVEGFPDAVKVIRLNGEKAKRLADMALHKSDLDFAAECLDAINSTPEQSVVRQALWRSAVIHFTKCFGQNKGRPSQLSSKKVYKGDLLGQEIFDYFLVLRNKHFVHDENSYTQSIPGAILNKRDHAHKIEKIVCLAAVGATLDQRNFSSLHLLVTKAREWVIADFDRLCQDLTHELEGISYDDLYEREAVVYSPPKLSEIKVNRNAP